jgi:riboflavin synthase
MFTGIIQAQSPVVAVSVSGKVRRVSVQKPARWKLVRGESISIDGICSTVENTASRSFFVSYMPETLKKTTAGSFAQGYIVNLERALKLGDRLGGHLVHGHVDARGTVVSVDKEGRSRLLTVRIPGVFTPFVERHGSIALNGVSLTVARKRGNTITVALIPYTLSHTNLGALAKGDEVNIETDAILRNLRLLRKNAKVSRNAARPLRERSAGTGRLAAPNRRRRL